MRNEARRKYRSAQLRNVVLRGLLLLLPIVVQAQMAKPGSPLYPAKEWERFAKPEDAGYSSARLQALRTWLQALDTTAMMVVVKGRSLFEYGDLTHQSYLASARKSVLAILYGKYVENGTVALNKTLRELEFTDVGGLMPMEQNATIEHLLTARSGIYHPASNPGDSTESAPPRNSQPPGGYYLYNNWDFNAAGAVLEKLTGRDVYDLLETDLAQPIGMQDFTRARQQKFGDDSRSQHKAYHIWLSARDMARIGLLMLREGKWEGKQIISSAWARRITSLGTPFHELNPPSLRSLGTGNRWGYGYMWWVWDAPNSPGSLMGAYQATGAFGQFITVLPQLDMVIAHKVDSTQDSPHGPKGRKRSVPPTEFDSILRMLIAAKCPDGKCP